MKNWTDLNIGKLVIYKNNQFIAFNKPPGLPVQEDKTGDAALVKLAESYAKRKLHLIHRIDRPTSGVVLFSRTMGALQFLNAQFQERSVRKTYLAVVKQAPPHEASALEHYLKKDGRQNRSIVKDKPFPGAKAARLNYRLLGQSESYHLLEIDLPTGRHHQVRAQLAAIGCPIKGDVKYGFRRGNPDRSVHLHAWKLQFEHPVAHTTESITAELPDDPVWNAFRNTIDRNGDTA